MVTTLFHMVTSQPTPEDVAHALGDALSAAGVTQREASERSGIPLVTLSRRLTAKTPLNVVELAMLSTIAGVTVTDVVVAATRRHGEEGDAA